jgi:thiamine biosynthesis lipoprotein
LRSGSARQPGGARLDLSAIAKGYAVDSVAQRLASEGLVSYLVEIGGELRGRGVKPDGQPWWVSVEPPPGCPLQVTSALSGWAIATSGDYRRFFEHGGRRYAHTLDPRTGRPLDDPPASVSVLHAECMAADAWSTALMVLGAGRGLALCEREGLSAVFLLRDPWRAVVSRGFRRMLS